MKSIQCLVKKIMAGALMLGLMAGVSLAQAETLRVGATSTGIPFTFLDVKTNSIQGMMVDTAHAVAEAAGFEAEIEQTVFSALIPSLQGNKIDIISAAMLQTEKRAKVVDFTDSVYAFGDGLLVHEDDDTAYESLDDLEGEVVGAQVGTVFVDLLQDKGYFKEVRSYDNMVDLARDVALGRIKAGVADEPILAYQIAQGTLKKVKLVDSYEPESVGEVSLVVRKSDTELKERINKAIQQIKEDGTLDKIIEKWGV